MREQARRFTAKIRPFSFLSLGLFALVLSLALSSCALVIEETRAPAPGSSQQSAVVDSLTSQQETTTSAGPAYGSEYLALDDVASYLIRYEELPPNYLRKSEAYDLGWEPDEGNLWIVAEGAAIGGDRFGNREGLLPDEAGRDWFEADVNYTGGYRGPERLVYSDDGLFYYTADHYASFEFYDEVEGWGD